MPAAPNLRVTAAHGLAYLAVGAATHAIAEDQIWPEGSDVDLTVYQLVDRAGVQQATWDLAVTATRVSTGEAVIECTEVPMDAVPGAAGAYRVTIGAGILTRGRYRLVAVATGPASQRQQIEATAVVAPARGVSGLAAPIPSGGAFSGTAWRRAAAGFPPA